MNSPRRAEDRGHPRSPKIEAIGCLTRIFHVAPGENFSLREGTLELEIHALRRITLRHVFALLEEERIITDANGVYTKIREDLGMTNLTPEESIQKIIVRCSVKQEQALDLHNKNDMQTFLTLKLRRLARAAHSELSYPDCSEYIGEIAPSLTSFIHKTRSPEMRLVSGGMLNPAYQDILTNRITAFLLSKEISRENTENMAEHYSIAIMHALHDKGWQ